MGYASPFPSPPRVGVVVATRCTAVKGLLLLCKLQYRKPPAAELGRDDRLHARVPTVLSSETIRDVQRVPVLLVMGSAGWERGSAGDV